MSSDSLERTVKEAGPSIASNALQVGAGIPVMCLSDMVPMQRFGLLVADTMVLTAATTFVLLPSLRAERVTAEETTEEESHPLPS